MKRYIDKVLSVWVSAFRSRIGNWHMIINICVLTTFLLIVVLALSCSKKPNEIKIGAILPLTGDAAAWGERAREGIELAIESINAEGGLRGMKVKVIYEDSKAAPQDGVNAIRKLITVDKAQVVIGDVVSAVVLAIAPLANENKVVLISPSASAPAITNSGEYVFRNWPSDIYEGEILAEFAVNTLKLKKIAILYINNDYGVGLQDVFTKTFENLGGKILIAENYIQDTTDFRTQIGKIKAKKPDGIYLISYYKDAALILRQSKEMGVHTHFLGASAIEDPKLLELANDLAEGLIYPVSSGYDPTNKEDIVQKFRDKFKEKYGKEPAYLQAQAYDAMKIVALAIKEGGATGTGIQKAMSRIKDFPGVTGKTSFDQNGDVIKPMIIKTVRNGKFVGFLDK